jgi:hypothetical protein
MSTTAGYSGTPLGRKLGIRAGSSTVLVGAPEKLSLGALEPGAVVARAADASGAGRFDVALLFCADVAALTRGFEPLRDLMEPTSALWVCWPKKASRVVTDLDENLVRDHGLRCGLVDVKVAAVDQTWSALKFVYRLADRPAAPSSTPRASRIQA